jgi:hypothetical protein
VGTLPLFFYLTLSNLYAILEVDVAKATLIIEDSGDNVDFKMHFHPPIEKDKNLSPAQYVGLNVAEIMVKFIKEIE